MANSLDFTVRQGETFSGDFTGVNTAGDILNLTDYSARGQVRFTYGATGTLIDLSPVIDSGNLNDGAIFVNLTATQTAGLPPTRNRYDIEVVSGDSVTRVVEGRINILPEITK